MDKVRLGRTGLMVTRIGFGGLPIQRVTETEAVKVVERCLDLGINFIDTANGYTVSEERIGKAIKGRRRQDVIIATKTYPGTADDIRRNLDLSLKRLQTDYIDIYQFHQVSNEGVFRQVLGPGDDLYAIFEEAKKAGKIRHIGVSSHQIDIAKKLVASDRFETLMFPFNFITREAADELLPLCRKHDVGFIDMKPMAGGMLYDAPVAFKWLFRFPDIALIPGIKKIEEIEEIIDLYEGSHEMTDDELARMQVLKDELGTRFCRQCDYCQPCSQEIAISMVMAFPSFVKRLPETWFMEGMVRTVMNKAAECIECGECETRCPYDLPIREMLRENYDLFEKIKAESAG